MMLSKPLATAGDPAPPSDQAFTLSGQGPLKIAWRGKPLVNHDELAAIGPDSFTQPDGVRDENVGDWKVSNLWRIKDRETKTTYRREVAGNGREVELTVEFRVPAYYTFPYQRENAYSFSVPLKALEGMTFRARGGRSTRPKETDGIITAQMPDGSLFRDKEFGTTVSLIAFEGNGTPGLVFDFNPSGLSAFNDYGPTVLQGLWRIEKKGATLRFSFGGTVAVHQGVFASKLRILEGSFEEDGRLHAHSLYNYFSTLPAVRKFSFGPGSFKKWQPAGKEPYTPETGFGWTQTDGIAVEGDTSGGVLHGRAQGNGEHHFLIDVPQPGIYLFTLRIAANETAIGPLTLSCNGHVITDPLEVAPGEIKTVTFSTYTDTRRVELGYSGAWAINSIAMQTLIYATEDFSFKRGVWLVRDVPTPTTLHQFSPSMPPVRAFVESTRQVSRPDEQTVRKAKLVAPKTLEQRNTPGMAWRWSGNIGSLGPANYGSFYEFETDEKIGRRLDELSASGYQVLILNGLHFRTCWPEQEERTVKTIARIVELAHQRGMKIVEHRSSTVIPNQGTGFNQMLRHLDQTLREVDSGQVTRGYCLNHPVFQESFLNGMAAWVAKTGSDGLMLDELSFHTKEFCGCTHCRARFFADTGVELPTDDTDPAFFNPEDRLWALWLEWRNQTLGDWSVELLRRVRKINPDFVLMKYSTHYGAVSNSVTTGQGGGLAPAARSSNFIGTEIMSRNVYATYRANLAYRSIFNSFRNQYGVPIFGLIYPVGQATFAYAGWAMNNMRGQSTWSIIGNDAIEGKASASYANWKDNMDLHKARTLADVAVIYSTSSRDFSRYFSHSSDLVGTCEQLDDFHIPYDVLLNDALTSPALEKYRLIILPSVCSMSDEEVTAVENYLHQGGRVLALGHTALFDETGGERSAWPIGQWLDLQWSGNLMKGPLELEGEAVGPQAMEFPDSILKVLAKTTTKTTRLLAKACQGDTDSVAIAEGDVGQGKLLFVAPRLGAANYEPELTIGRKWEYRYNPHVAHLFQKMLKRARPGIPVFEAVAIPREVRISLYEQDDGDQTLCFVHLYNGTGATPQAGKNVPRTAPKEPFPQLPSDIVFHLTLETQKEVTAELVSPDFELTRVARLEKLGEHRYRITVSKDDLKAYSIVRLRYEASGPNLEATLR